MDAVDFFKSYSNLSEHLITLAIALLTLSITFLDKLKANLKTRAEYNLFIALWVLLTISIFLGLLSSYLCVDQSVKCANPDPNVKCETTPLMEYSLGANLIVFFSSLVLVAIIGFKTLTNSKKDIIDNTKTLIPQPTNPAEPSKDIEKTTADPKA